MHLIDVSGARYDTEEIATMTEQIDDLLMDLRFRDAAPMERPAETV